MEAAERIFEGEFDHIPEDEVDNTRDARGGEGNKSTRMVVSSSDFDCRDALCVNRASRHSDT